MTSFLYDFILVILYISFLFFLSMWNLSDVLKTNQLYSADQYLDGSHVLLEKTWIQSSKLLLLVMLLKVPVSSLSCWVVTFIVQWSISLVVRVNSSRMEGHWWEYTCENSDCMKHPSRATQETLQTFKLGFPEANKLHTIIKQFKIYSLNLRNYYCFLSRHEHKNVSKFIFLYLTR